MSKMTKNKFEGGKEAFGTKVITDRFNDTAAKLDIPSKNPIPNKPVEIDPEVYTNISVDISTMPHVHQALLLAAINGQAVEYVVMKRELKVKQKDLTNPGKELCIKFMKERLSFTREGKMKPYSSLSGE